MFKTGRIEIRGPRPAESWTPFEFTELRFARNDDDSIEVESTVGEQEQVTFTRRVKDSLRPLSYWVAFHGLAAQEYCLTSILRSDGEQVRVGAFDIRLSDPRDWRGLHSGPWLDLTEARDFWIDQILAAGSSRSSQELRDDGHASSCDGSAPSRDNRTSDDTE